MTSPDIELSTDEVRQHARMVDEAAAMYREAVSGTEYIDTHDEVYGVLCSPLFLPLVQPAQEWALSEIRETADATAHLADVLRAFADDIDRSDDGVAQQFGTVR